MTTVGKIINKLKEFPEDMPVGIDGDIHISVTIEKRTWHDSNYPYAEPDVDFVNIE